MPLSRTNLREITVDIQSLVLAVLILVWSIPHTIGVRNSAGIFLLLTAFPFLIKDLRTHGIHREFKIFWGLLFVLSTWIVLQAVTISPEPMWALNEARGQWDTTLLFALLAMSLGSIHTNRDQLLRVAVFVLMVLTAYYVLEGLKQWHYTGEISTRRVGLHDSPVLQSYLNALLMAFLIGDLYVSFFKGKRTFLSLPLSLTLGLIAMVAFATYLTRIRLGVIGIVALLLSGGLLLLARKNLKAFLVSLFIFSSAGTLFVFHYNDDARWARLFQTVELAVDIDGNRAWVGDGTQRPKLADGSDPGNSNYERIAWATAGIHMILENPLGVGYGRNSFGHEGQREYGLKNLGHHSHSGLIDWTLAVGFPGLLLWLGFNAYLLILSAKAGFGEKKDPLAVALFLITTSALYRSAVDSTLRDHLLQMNMFFMAYLTYVITTRTRTNEIKQTDT
jgi:hypothetical protein